MTSIGKILELFISIGGTFDRVNKREISLDKKGILEDKFYGKNAQRSVLITTKDSYSLSKKSGIDMEYSQLGENLLIDYNPYHLLIGTRLKIGDVVLELSQNCTLCKSLSKIDTKLPKLLRDDRGIFAQVIESGSIKKGDDIYII